MAQHDYNIANQTGLEFRADLNNALQAIVTDNSGPTEPSTTFPGMVWRDTSSSPSVLKKRNDANSGWVTVLTASGEAITGATDASSQRTALGLGTSATFNVGTAAYNIVQLDSKGKLPALDASQLTNIASSQSGYFYKVDSSTVAFNKTGSGTAQIKAGTEVNVSGTVVKFSTDTNIAMPTLLAGTDYVIWVKDDGTIQASSNFLSSPGTGNWRKIGGFNYAPGGLATGTSGGDTTPQILAGTFWDLKFRPACSDPRGMKLVADAFWADLWMLNTDPAVNGTSKYGATIADGGSPPKVPSAFGGNGTTTYPNGNWWNMAECLRAYGKRLPTYSEFAALAYGTTEATSRGTDPGTCQVDAARTSQHVFQATGNLWTWGDEFIGGAAAGWTANTGGRGSTNQMGNAVAFGGSWDTTSYSGSRASSWSLSPATSDSNIAARGVCDHLILD